VRDRRRTAGGRTTSCASPAQERGAGSGQDQVRIRSGSATRASLAGLTSSKEHKPQLRPLSPRRQGRSRCRPLEASRPSTAAKRGVMQVRRLFRFDMGLGINLGQVAHLVDEALVEHADGAARVVVDAVGLARLALLLQHLAQREAHLRHEWEQSVFTQNLPPCDRVRSKHQYFTKQLTGFSSETKAAHLSNQAVRRRRLGLV